MRYALIVVAVIVGLIAVIAIIGWSLPVRHHAEAARTYRTTPAGMYALITDVTSYPSWRSDVKRVETLPAEDGRVRWIETPKNGPPITFLVERSTPGQLLVTKIANTDLPFGGSWTYEITPSSNGQTTLRLTEDGEVYNPIFRFVSRFVMGHDATMKQYLASVGTRFPEIDGGASTRQ
jgi:uncharacterized protein YndB with AHSA1/START domain